MERRCFGDGVRVSVLGIGCGRVGSISNPVPMREIEATLEAAIEAGVNLFDTANIYGQGDSERTLARLLRRYRDHMFVVTKVGGRVGRYAGLIRLAKPVLRLAARSRHGIRSAVVEARTATVVHDFSPSDLTRAAEASRRRLGVDRLDGLLLHSPSAETLRDPQIHGVMHDILERGGAARVGASVDSFAALESAIAIPALTMIQAPIDVATLLPGTAALDAIRHRRIGLFVRGVLFKKIKMTEKNPQENIAEAIELDFVTSAIVGVSTRRHLKQLLPTSA